MKLSDITLLTCTFNNNKLTKCMIMSLFKQLEKEIPVVIMDNGTVEFCTEDMKDVFTVIDNTNFKITPDYKHISKNHCSSIDYAIKNYIHTKYVMLCDNDILFKSNIKKLFSMLENIDDLGCIGEIEKSFYKNNQLRLKRLLPFFCIISVDLVKQFNYFNDYYTMNKNLKSTYDTGGYFFKMIEENNIKHLDIKINEYIIHLTQGNWNKSDNYKENWLNQYKVLYEFNK